ncbi:glycosyltransferase family 4 protein [Pantanalinema sp. GBBB05]|uniref:glycosyltransferase family 4 protein n=1 Tax=Pantanalinema sp. GBBB05 TaxID=2604139 RepID=UPI001DF91C8A|nr:glycosyltransferase family 4 protein [Pantanalinema sp. GBBB05]
MHLIALEQAPTSLRGGQELNLLEICRDLSQRGHQVTLLYEREGNLLEQYRKFCQHVIRINSYGFDRRRIDDVLNFFPSLIQLGTVPVSQDSVIFSNVYHTVFWGYLLARYRQRPFVCYLQVPPFDFNRQRLLGLKGVDRFIAVSSQTKQNWTKIGYEPEKIDVVLNGTDINKFQPAENLDAVRSQWGVPQQHKIISYVGRLDKDKGLETLITAFALALKTNSNAHLLIAGKPLLHISPINHRESPEECRKYEQSLEQLVADFGIQNQVKFLGHITNTEALYQASDITVVPSRWPDPCPRVVIEAMSCGTPVVASRMGGIPEVLTGEFDSQLVEPEQPQRLADTLSQVMTWRDHNPELGQRCRDHILNHFSREKMVDGIERSLLQVLHQNDRSLVGSGLVESTNIQR